MKVVKAEFLESVIRESLDAIIQLRRSLHRVPELGFQEYETGKLLKSFIKSVPGVHIEEGIAKTGFVATLGEGKPGKCIAFRADMDGLPISETTGVSYASQHEGRMHACGHDGHSAILAGLVKVLSSCQDHLSGPVKFIFQPAEEGGGGAKVMVEAGVLENPRVDAIFGLHGWPSLEIGQVAAESGPFFASTNAFDIVVRGTRGHAAFPHKSIDPIPVAASIISQLQTLVSRSTDPLDSAVLSICEIKGGSTYNVIPDEVTMKGTLRCFSQSNREYLLSRIETLVAQIASAHEATATVALLEEAYPVLINDGKACAFFKQTMGTLTEFSTVDPFPASMGGEDFAYFAEKVPACFWLLGVKDPLVEEWPFLHTSNYNFNDAAIEVGIRIQAELALKFQEVGF